MGTTKHSLASKARWKGVSVAKKKAIMSEVAKAKWSKTSEHQRKLHAKKMREGKKLKVIAK